MQKITLLLLFGTLLLSCGRTDRPGDPIDKKVDSLLSLMTIEEKVGQLTLYTSDWDVTGPTMRPGYKQDIREGKVGAIFNAVGAAYTRKLQEMAVNETRLHIPLLFGYDVIHGHQTIFPIPLGIACSWDMDLIKKSARVSAEEASAQGLHWTYSPMVDISRDPRWGRVMEGYGEDPYLTSAIGKAMVEGYQGEGIHSNHSVMACVKHFAAYGASQAGRDYHMVDMSERVLRETYLPSYKAAVDAGAATVMTSFNELDGVPASMNQHLLQEILRDEWKFKGFVVSDYTSIMEMLQHGTVGDTTSAAVASLNAGLDMDMQAGFYQAAIPAMVKAGKVSPAILDESVRRILRKKFELGLFKDPYRFCDEAREKETILNPSFLEEARTASAKSTVLLKNEGGILPLSKSYGRIAVIGPLGKARRDMIGSWSAAGDWSKAVTLLEGVKQVAAPGTEVVYSRGCGITGDSTQLIDEAVRVARSADVVILALGEAAWMTGEAASRSSLDLPGVQLQLAEAIRKTSKPVVAVLFNGRPLTLTWLDQHVPAILEAWYPGTMGGLAVADVLFGKVNPAGKLTMTFPQSVGQVPIYYSMKNTGRPMEPNNKYTSKYLDISNEPLYPFGYGLSYTQFTYGPVTMKAESRDGQQVLTASVVLTNSGQREGEEVVQLYVRDWVGSVTRPVRELKSFQKLNLKPGEKTEVTFTITSDDLKFYRQDMSVGNEAGDYSLFIGGNSRDTQQGRFRLLGQEKAWTFAVSEDVKPRSLF